MVSAPVAASAATPLTPVPQHQRIGNVIDVLGSTGEMQEGPDPGQFGILTEALADEILDRLDVMIGPALDFLDATGIVRAKLAGYVIQYLVDDRRQWPKIAHRAFGCQAYPAHFREHTDQAVLEDFPQGIGSGG
jgi:hypothetical protein